MALKQVIENIISTKQVEIYDQVIIQSFVKSLKWTSLQRIQALKIVSKYGNDSPIEIIQSSNKTKRAVLRQDRIYLFADLQKTERNKLLRIPGRNITKDGIDVPYNRYSMNVLEEMKFVLSPNLLEKENKQLQPAVKNSNGQPVFPDKCMPHEYQWQGWQLIEKFNGRCLLADQPRLGKTIQSIIYLANHPELRPALIIVPSSIKIQWYEEIKKWLPDEMCAVINGRKGIVPKEGIAIINYDILYDHYCEIEERDFKIIIPDECHRVKNIQAKRTRAFKYIAKTIPHIIGLSGTPANNRPSEFFTILNVIQPDMFGNHQQFLNRYCNAQKDPSGKGATNIEELHDILKKTLMIRRTREEVWKEIPSKQRIVVPVEIDNRDEYITAEKDLISYLRETKGNRAAQNAIRSQAFAKFNTLKDIAARGKLKQAIEWIEDFIENEKLVVFCIHRKMVEALEEHFTDSSVKLYGGMTNKAKDKAVKQFANSENTKLFIGNLTAANLGLPLHVANATFTLEYGWVPADHEQAEDRVINKEKVNVPIAAYYMTAVNTIEETIAQIIDSKTKVLTRLLDGKEAEEEGLLTYLIQQYSER